MELSRTCNDSKIHQTKSNEEVKVSQRKTTRNVRKKMGLLNGVSKMPLGEVYNACYI